MRILRACVALTVLLGLFVRAQSPIPVPSPTSTVLSGNEIGFQIDSTTGGVPTGKLVVKINGKWVEPKYTTSTRLLSR